MKIKTIIAPVDKNFLHLAHPPDGTLDTFPENGWLDSVRDFASKTGMSNSVLIAMRYAPVTRME